MSLVAGGETASTDLRLQRPIEKSIRGPQAEPPRVFDFTRHGAVDGIPNQ